MRGVVSLAIAFSIPLTVNGGEGFPERNLILFLTFTTVIGTLVIQGLTLPPLIRLLKLPGRDQQAETLAEANAQAQASRAPRPGWTNSSRTRATNCRRRWSTASAPSWNGAATPSGSGSAP